MQFLQKLYDCKSTDITLFGVGFHSYVIKVVFESCRSLNLFTQEKITEMWNTCGLEPSSSEFVEDLSCETKEDKSPTDSEEIAEELKRIVYGTKTRVDSSVAVYVYAIIDFLGGLEDFTRCFTDVNSVQFCTYLFRFSSDKKLVKSICKNTPGKITELVDVGEELFDMYTEKFEDPKSLHLYLSTKTDILSVHRYAATLQTGYGVEQDYKKALEIFTENRAYPRCLHKCAYMIQNGYGCEKDPKTAFSLYKENEKYPPSLYNYTLLLRNGEGCEKDEKLARELFLKNWEENKHDNSLGSYACMLFLGQGGEPDHKQARELFRKNGEENGHAGSLHSYAVMLRDENVGEKDRERAMELFWKNWIENGYAESLHSYAVICMQDGHTKKARELYKENWEKNKHKKSLEQYVYCLEHGIGGEKNIQLADELCVYLI